MSLRQMSFGVSPPSNNSAACSGTRVPPWGSMRPPHSATERSAPQASHTHATASAAMSSSSFAPLQGGEGGLPPSSAPPNSLFAHSDLRQLTGTSLRLDSLRNDSGDLPGGSYNARTGGGASNGAGAGAQSSPHLGALPFGRGGGASWSVPEEHASQNIAGVFRGDSLGTGHVPTSGGMRQYSVSAGAGLNVAPQGPNGGAPPNGSDVKQAGYSLLSMSWDSVGQGGGPRRSRGGGANAGAGGLNTDPIQAPPRDSAPDASSTPHALRAAAAGIANAIQRSDTLRVDSWRQVSGTGESGMFSEGSGYIPVDEARSSKQPRRAEQEDGVSGGGSRRSSAAAQQPADTSHRRPVPTVQPGTQMQSMDAAALNAMLGDDDDEGAGGVQGGYPANGSNGWGGPGGSTHPPPQLPGTDEILRQMAPAGFAQVSLRPLETEGGNGGAGGSRHQQSTPQHTSAQQHRHDGGESVASGSISSKSGGVDGGGRIRSRATAGSRALPTSAVRILKEWMLAPENYDHPWPTEEEKVALADKCGITVRQVTVWLTNGRKRVWKPLREAQGLPVTDYKQARSAKKRAELSSIAKAGGAGGGGTKRPRSEEGMQGGAPTPAPSPAAAAAERDQLIALHSSLAGMLSQLQGAVQQLQAADALKEQQSAQLAQAAQAVLSQTQDSACDGRARQLLALLASGQQQRGQQQQQQGRRR